jgi:hypothetical protein
MVKSILVSMPTAVLWEFREFKRDEVPAPKFSFMQTYNVDEVTEFVESNGAMEPVELAIIGAKALLTDGNHRIVAAKRLGYKMIPVKVVVIIGEHSSPFYDHTIERFKPISKHLELWLKRFFFMLDFKRRDKIAIPSILLETLNFNGDAHLN